MWSNLAVEGNVPSSSHDFIEELTVSHHLPPEDCEIIYLDGRLFAIETVQEV